MKRFRLTQDVESRVSAAGSPSSPPSLCGSAPRLWALEGPGAARQGPRPDFLGNHDSGHYFRSYETAAFFCTNVNFSSMLVFHPCEKLAQEGG